MNNAEQLDPFQEPTVSPGARQRGGPFRRRGRPHPPAAGTAPVPAMPTPEQTNLDIHKERVAAQVLTLFDAGVGRLIGHTGNVRDELRRRLISTSPHQHSLDTNGLDPVLQRYLQHDVFFFRLDNASGGVAASYAVDCQVGRFMPSIQVETADGFVKATLFTGPNNDQFHHAQISRVFNDDRVRQITTFTPNYRDAYDPPHPLMISQGALSVPRCNVIYDGIDSEGNVTLLDGQNITDPSGRFSGRYFAADHSMVSITPSRFPWERSGNGMIIGEPGEQVRFPYQTNIYAELADITSNIRSIASS